MNPVASVFLALIGTDIYADGVKGNQTAVQSLQIRVIGFGDALKRQIGGDDHRLAAFHARFYVHADFDTNRKALSGTKVPKIGLK